MQHYHAPWAALIRHALLPSREDLKGLGILGKVEKQNEVASPPSAQCHQKSAARRGVQSHPNFLKRSLTSLTSQTSHCSSSGTGSLPQVFFLGHTPCKAELAV